SAGRPCPPLWNWGCFCGGAAVGTAKRGASRVWGTGVGGGGGGCWGTPPPEPAKGCPFRILVGDDSPTLPRRSHTGPPPTRKRASRCYALRPPGRGDFSFSDFSHAPSAKNLSKNGSRPERG